MVHHQFVERNESPLQYRLIFDRRRAVHISLPAPALFDYQEKGRYVITREEADEYERRVEATRRHAAAQEAIAAVSQYDPNYYYGVDLVCILVDLTKEPILPCLLLFIECLQIPA